MIDYKELRIGNWIRQSKRSGGVTANEFDCQVHEVNRKGLNIGFGGVYLEWQFCEGIPLSEEILLKCGFERYLEDIDPLINEDIEYWNLGNVCFFFDCYGCLVIANYHLNINRPKYLHQLQNLYYSLTNEELIYKP